MRLWHPALIDVLPKKQVGGQWSELNSIFKNKINHGLINFAYDYRDVDLYIYTLRIIKRAIELKINIKKYDHFNNYFSEFMQNINPLELDMAQAIFVDKMNNRYLLQCLLNLQEKHDCKMILDNEWELVYGKFKKVFSDITECETYKEM